MKICIFTETGDKVGLGHLTRCIALSQAAKTDKVTILVHDWIKEKNRTLKLVKQADLVIVDSYLSPKSLYQKMFKAVSGPSSFVVIDDYKRLDYPFGIVLNPAIHGDKFDYDCKKKLAGKDYVIMRKEFWRVPVKRIRENIKDVLITFGGKSNISFIKKLLGVLTKHYPEFKWHVVLAKPIKLKGARFYTKLSAVSMRKLMVKCDFCICAGGQTLHELARCGLASIAICFADNQQTNLRGLAEQGVLTYVGWYTDKKIFNKVKKAIESYKPKSVRKKKSAIARKLIDGCGAKRIISEIKKAKFVEDNKSFSLRQATKDDCRSLWSWRNHPRVRKYSYTTGKIPYSEHKKWFDKKISDKKNLIYIAQRKRDKLGQVRFDLNSKFTHININLNPKFFGKGIGSALIRKASQKFLQNNPKIKQVKANVFCANKASIRAFQKAGYVLSKKNKKVAVFKF